MDAPVLRVAREPASRPGSFFYHIEDGWHYHLSYVREGSTYFKCVMHCKGCRGRAVYDGVEGFQHTGNHNHEADVLYPQEMELRRNILLRCERMELLTFHQIIFEEGRRFPAQVVSRVTYCRMRTPMRNARMKHYPPPPANLEELTAILQNPQFEVLTMTDDGQDNIYGGSVTDTNGFHHVLFMSDRMVQRAREFTVIHSDGTFKSVPIGDHFADQVFCLVGVWSHHIIPLGWCLMTSRTQVAYTAVLGLLLQLLGQEIQLNRVITDFETAEQNAWHEVFHVTVQGCLWHLCRAFIQEVAELNLIVRMRRIEEVRRVIRLTMALPLLPEDLIVTGYHVILRHARDEGNYVFRIVRPYLTYVWRYWVNRPWRRARMTVHGSKQRTNNVCESQNFTLRKEVGTHSNVYLFLAGLVKLEQRAYNTMMSLEEGRRVSRGRKRSSVYNDRRVRQLSEEIFNPPGAIEATIFRFLNAVSHTVDGMVEELIADRVRGRQRRMP